MACLAAVLLIFAWSAQAQAPPAVVKAKLLLATDAAHPGDSAQAAVVAQITPGYHINDHHPSLDYLIPTDLKLDSGKTFSVEKIAYPRGTLEKFIFSKSGLSVYEGQIAIEARLKVARDVRPGEYPLRGKLEYQACNDHACLAPASVPLALTVRIAGPNVPLRRINSNVFRRIGPE
jgi:DsbC/DsbD-like thiol-disulfide interchange protein